MSSSKIVVQSLLMDKNEYKNKKLKIAIAGLGFGKKVHLEALKESHYLKPVAIYHYEKAQN